jgi:hypothetical protein
MEYTFKLPQYLWGFPKTEDGNVVYYTFNIDKPFDCIDDFIQYFAKNSIIVIYIDCDELIRQIENRNAYKIIFDRPESLKTQVYKVYTGIPPIDRHRYEDKYDEIKVALKTNNSISCKWIYANQDKVFEFIETEKKRICNEYKQQKKITNKTYYDLNKELTDRVLLTEQEKKDNKKKTNEKYYNLNKEPTEKVLLTEQEKKDNKKKANEKYYNLNKEPTEKVLLTQEEKKDNKKKANEKYYLKQKENVVEIPKVLLTQEQKQENKKKANQLNYLKNKNNKVMEKVFEIIEPDNDDGINFEIQQNYIEIVETQKVIQQTLQKIENTKLLLTAEEKELNRKETQRKYREKLKEQNLTNI